MVLNPILTSEMGMLLFSRFPPPPIWNVWVENMRIFEQNWAKYDQNFDSKTGSIIESGESYISPAPKFETCITKRGEWKKIGIC